jgi:hypothetical protein
MTGLSSNTHYALRITHHVLRISYFADARRRTIDERMTELEKKLNDFAPATRAGGLAELASLARGGAVSLEPEGDVVNMHCHTFFSFNGYGYSPTGLAWLGKRRGFKALGIVDFDVLDGVDEFLDACEAVGLRGSAGIETRVFVPEFATREATGRAAQILADLRQRAASRNRGVLQRVNAHLQPVAIDYDRDVLPLTPGGNATERHMLAAYVTAAEEAYPGRAERVRFWAEKLDVEPPEIDGLIDDPPGFKNVIRARLMKRGGVGYVQPGPETFPGVDEFHEMVVLLGALPCFAWLDGTSEGEQAIEELLGLMVAKGAVAVNIVPDRNWNIRDPDARRVKVRNLHQVVRLARELDLPLNVGTEMNRFGLKLVDDFDAPELAPVREPFLEGAFFIYGHTVLQRALGLGYQSEWAENHLPSRRERNDFYTRVGHLVEPGQAGVAQLRQLDPAMSPADILSKLGRL